MNIRFKFMKYRKIAGIVSIIIFSISVLSLTFRGLSLGLDFSGGTLVEVTYETPVELESIRTALTNNGFEDSQVVNFGTNLDVLIIENYLLLKEKQDDDKLINYQQQFELD